MLKRNKKLMNIILAVLIASSINVFENSNVSAAPSRVGGQDRYETAVEVSKQGWQTSDYVVLASGEGYADALCAAPLAKKYNAPILLTESNTLNEKTKEEIKRLNAKHIFIIGKSASVSDNAEKELTSVVGDVKRLGGNNRYETSVIVAKELGSISEVTITSGYGFADALSIAPIAAQKGMPILLTGKDELPSVVEEYIQQNKENLKGYYVVGGQGVISDNAAKQLSETYLRLNGQNRFETNLKVMQYFVKDLKFDNLYVVQADGPTGNEFADALSGTALAVKTSSPVILTYKTISSETESFIKENLKQSSAIIALGGVAAVPESIVNTLQADITGTSTVQPAPATPQTPAAGGGGGGTTTPTTSDGADGDIQFVFAAGTSCQVNINSLNNGDTINIVDKISKSNLTKIRIYSSTTRSLTLSINGFQSKEDVTAGWKNIKVPEAFIGYDGGDPGISQGGLDMLEGKDNKDGKLDLKVESESGSKSVVIQYR